MQWGSIVGTVTAGFTFLTAVGGFLVAFKVMIPNYKVNKDTHTIVNQQRTDMVNEARDRLRFQTVLLNALRAHDIEIPKDQSKLDLDT